MAPPKFGGNSVKCAACTKTVYPLEALVMESRTFHKRCFRCNHCDRVVGVGNFAMYQETVYCKPHFMKLFRTRGTYDFGNEDGSSAPAFGAVRSISTSGTSNPVSNAEVDRAGLVEEELSTKSASDSISSSPTAPVDPTDDDDTESSLSAPDKAADTVNSILDEAGAKDEPEYLTTKPGKLNHRKASRVLSALRKRDPQQLKETIDQVGLDVLFNKDHDGVTPIEFAFANNNLECGRLLLNLVQDELSSLKVAGS